MHWPAREGAKKGFGVWLTAGSAVRADGMEWTLIPTWAVLLGDSWFLAWEKKQTVQAGFSGLSLGWHFIGWEPSLVGPNVSPQFNTSVITRLGVAGGFNLCRAVLSRFYTHSFL